MKTLTLEQIESRQRRAVRAAEMLQDDPDLAEEIADLSPLEYAERKHYAVQPNPERIKKMPRKSMAELEAEIENLQDELEEAQAEIEDLKSEKDAVLDALGIELVDEDSGSEEDED